MKQPKKLTREQKEILSNHFMSAKEWSLIEDLGSYLKVINRETGKIKILDKRRVKK